MLARVLAPAYIWVTLQAQSQVRACHLPCLQEPDEAVPLFPLHR